MLSDMKFFIFATLLFFAFPSIAKHEQVVEIDLSGLTCSFCVYGLKKNLEKHDDVEKADISLKQNKTRIHLKPGATVNEEELKEIIKDAGFSSGNSQHYGKSEHPCDTKPC